MPQHWPGRQGFKTRTEKRIYLGFEIGNTDPDPPSVSSIALPGVLRSLDTCIPTSAVAGLCWVMFYGYIQVVAKVTPGDSSHCPDSSQGALKWTALASITLRKFCLF